MLFARSHYPVFWFVTLDINRIDHKKAIFELIGAVVVFVIWISGTHAEFGAWWHTVWVPGMSRRQLGGGGGQNIWPTRSPSHGGKNLPRRYVSKACTYIFEYSSLYNASISITLFHSRLKDSDYLYGMLENEERNLFCRRYDNWNYLLIKPLVCNVLIRSFKH